MFFAHASTIGVLDRRMSAHRTSPVTRSEELFAPVSPGIELCYQTLGDPSDEPLLLVMGLGGPMTWWPLELCEALARRGFFVVRYDNRDTGRSTKVHDRVRRNQLLRAFAGRGGPPPYRLSDMADDAIGLLDHLDIGQAHVVGVSMGAMIAQTLAVEHTARVSSLVSIMSTTGKRTVGWQQPRLLPHLLRTRSTGREGYVEDSDRLWQLIGSPGYPVDPTEMQQRAEETFDRGYDSFGVLRQMLAIMDQPNRGPRLRSLRLPATVIHGLDDPMVHVSGGRATAAAIHGAELLLIPGMGHDLPQELFPEFVDAIRRTADRVGDPR